jgi:imidazoleglycerol-phosphate dehydratase
LDWLGGTVSGRTAEISRATKETQITVTVNLDGDGKSKLKTGLPFLEHMLDQVARHGLIDITIAAQGDQEGNSPLRSCLCPVG